MTMPMVVIIFGLLQTILADDPYQQGSVWPRFRGNNNNTGLSSMAGPTSAVLLFSIDLDNNGASHSSPVFDSNGNIYVGSSTNKISAISAEGHFLWNFSTGNEVWGACTITRSNTILFSSYDNYTYSLDMSGSLLWRYNAANMVEAAPIEGPDGTVYIGSYDSFFYAISSSGSLKWKFETIGLAGVPQAIESTASVSSDGEYIYFGAYDQHVYALNPAGSQLWAYPTPDIIYTSPVIYEDRVIVGCYDSYVYVLNRFNGTFIWSYKTSGEVYSSPAVLDDGTIIVGDYGAYLHALTSAGSLIWSFNATDAFFSSPIVDKNGNIFIGNKDYNLYALNSKGHQLWSYTAVDKIYSSPGIGPQGQLAFTDHSNKLYVLGQISSSSSSSASSFTSGVVAAIAVCGVVFVALLVALGVMAYRHRQVELVYKDLQASNYSGNGSNGNNSSLGKSGNSGVSMQDNPLKVSSVNYSRSLSKYKSTNLGDVNYLISRNVPVLEWTSIRLDNNNSNPDQVILGKGSFGVVAKAIWAPQANLTSSTAFGVQITNTVKYSVPSAKASGYVLDSNGETEVAVKVMTKALASSSAESTAAEIYEKAIKSAIEEVSLIRTAEEKIVFKDCIIKVYGIVNGFLPRSISQTINVGDYTEAVGIVMRFEGGGSLQQLINRKDRATNPISIIEKLRLLKSIARGIAELHAAGIVHADIKPDNVLLSSDNPPEIRLADFGLSMIRGEASLTLSTLAETKHVKGTPIYCAPEILHNPFAKFDAETTQTDLVAKPSRKTDMYAFALLAWELLTEQRPFQAAPNEIVLSSMVHQGQRPSLEMLPKDCPAKVVALIEACWATDRNLRKTAVECFSLLQYQHGLLSVSSYDVYLSYEPSTLPLTNLVFHRLTQQGCRVWLRQGISDSSHTNSNNNSAGGNNEAIGRCRLLLAILNQKYQTNGACLQELRDAKAVQPPRPIIPVFVQPDYFSWSNQELTYLCQLRSSTLTSFDLSQLEIADSSKAALALTATANTSKTATNNEDDNNNNNNNNNNDGSGTARNTLVDWLANADEDNNREVSEALLLPLNKEVDRIAEHIHEHLKQM